jgi:predicted RNase H-like nuclease (RuvC/YqgF family)
MDEIDYQTLTTKLGEVTIQNKQLKRANLNMKREVKHLRRVIKKMKDEAAKDKKPKYNNGKGGNKHGKQFSIGRRSKLMG